MRRFSHILALAAVAAVAACSDQESPTTAPPTDPKTTPIPIGVYEFTITGIGGPSPSATAVRIDTGGALQPVDGRSLSLNTVGAGLDLQVQSVSSFSDGPGRRAQRYVTTTYRVRNSTGVNRSNITYVAFDANNTLGATPFVQLLKQNGTAADAALASRIVPSGSTFTGPNLELLSPTQDVLQVFDEAEVAGIPLPSGATSILPYGFVVRNIRSGTTRTIPSTADLNEYEGALTVGFRIPLAAGGEENDIFSLTFRMLAVEDTETRMTESIEEGQDSAAVRRLRARATALGATTVTVLAGSPAVDPAVVDYPGQRQICSVRTAGPAGAPTTTITTPGTYTQIMILRAGETRDPCAAYFRTGTAARPATNVNFQVTVNAVDRYGNLKNEPFIVDTVRVATSPGAPPAVIPLAPVALVGGVGTQMVRYSDYGNDLLIAIGRRNRGALPLGIAGVTRIWTSNGGTNDWHTGANWRFGAVPMSLDSVLIDPDSAALDNPTISSNVSIAGVSVFDGSTLSLGAFDLSASGNVLAGLTTGINSTTGRLILTGVAKTVQGRVPRLRVTGTYSLTGNVTGRAPIQVEAGRLTSGTYRLQAESN